MLNTGFPQLPPSSTRSGNWNVQNNFNAPLPVQTQTIKHSLGTQTTRPAQQPVEPNVSLSQLIDLLSRVLSLCHYPDMITAKETISKLAAETFSNIQPPKTISHNMASSYAAATAVPVVCNTNPLHLRSAGAPHSTLAAETVMDTCTETVQLNPSPIIGGHHLKKKLVSDTVRPSPVIGGKSRQTVTGKPLKTTRKYLITPSKLNPEK